MALATQYRTTGLWLEWHLIVPAAVIANYLKLFRSVAAGSGFLERHFATRCGAG